MADHNAVRGRTNQWNFTYNVEEPKKNANRSATDFAGDWPAIGARTDGHVLSAGVPQWPPAFRPGRRSTWRPAAARRHLSRRRP